MTALQRHPEWRTALHQQLLGHRVLELIDSGEVAWHQLQVRIQPAN